MSTMIKAEFGRRFREARDSKKLSRAALGMRLGISPKTIQSWEMGRTFIEDLSLIPAIESELDISISDLIGQALGNKPADAAAEAPANYGSRKQGYIKAGPLAPQFEVHSTENSKVSAVEREFNEYVAVPHVRPGAVSKPVSKLIPRDILGHVLIPASWVPRGGVLVAVRMGDSGMLPMIPLGGTVILDRRAQETDKAINRVMALNLQSKGMRIRRLVKDPVSGKLFGVTAVEGRRGRIPYREEVGDCLLGRVVGILAQPE